VGIRRSAMQVRRLSYVTVLATAGYVVVSAVAVGTASAGQAGYDSQRKTVAIVDDQAITEDELDATISSQLYELRRSQLDQFIDNYLLERAAKRAHLSIPDYLDKETSVTVSDADARAQYDKYKGQIKIPFDQLKPSLLAELTSQRQAARQAALQAKLRSDSHVEIKLEEPHSDIAILQSPSLGPANAPVTIIEFGDFQSDYCRAEEPVLQQVRNKYRDQVRLVYKHFPILNSKDSVKAAEAAGCANEQGKFWQFHDALCGDPSKLADLKATARGLGLDSAKFDSCLDSRNYTSSVEEDIEEGLGIGVRSAPTFFVNGHPHAGVLSTAGFQSMIDLELQGKGQTETKSQ
jgi:protein-disulfide isomerase